MFEDSVSIPSIWASVNSWLTPTVLFVLLNLMIGTILFSSSLATTRNPHQQQQQEEDPNHEHPNKIARSPSVLQRLRSINLYSYRSQEPHHPSPPIATTLFKSDDHFDFQQTNHLQQPIETNTHFDFEQTHQPQIDTHFDFEQPHQQQQPKTNFNFQEIVLQEQEAHFDFQQAHQELTTTHFDFQGFHDTHLQDTDTHFDFDRIHEQLNLENGEGEEEAGEMKSLDEIYSQLSGGHHVSRTTSDTKPASGEVPAKLPAKIRKSASMKSAFGHFEEADIVEIRRPATVRERRTARLAEVDEEVDAKADDFINKFKQQLKLQRLDSIIRYKEVISRGSAK